MSIFYHPDFSQSFLSGEESNHAIRVLRLKKGDLIEIIDGKGGFFEGEITDPHPRKCQIKILKPISSSRSRARPHLHLAVAPTKNIQRFEWFLEKATEIGIGEITPLICLHSERKVLNIERLNKVLISALKQSKNLFLPKLNPPAVFSDFIALPINSINRSQQGFGLQKFIAHYSGIHLKENYKKGNGALILIGPEGDFSEKEIQLAKEKDFIEVSLGQNRLRTETAALVACLTISIMNE